MLIVGSGVQFWRRDTVKIYLLILTLHVSKKTRCENSLPVGFWRLEISDSGQCQRGPVQRSEVLLKSRRVIANRSRIAPLAAESLGRRDEEVEGGKPVRAEEQNVGKVGDSPHVRINRPCFYHVNETNQPV